MILRLDAPLYFFNANVARAEILAQARAEPRPRAILLDFGASADLDIGTSDMMRDLIAELRRNNVDVLLAQVRGSVRQRMQKTGLFDYVGGDCMYPSVVAAVSAYESGAFEERDPLFRDAPEDHDE